MSDLLASSKALLALDADGALVPHGLGGHGRTCLEWCVAEIERLRTRVDRLSGSLALIADEDVSASVARETLAEALGEIVAASDKT